MNERQAAGIGLGGALGVLFIGLKLTGYITWSWWWVLAPLWIPIAVVILVLFGLAVAFVRLVETQNERREQWRHEIERRRDARACANEHGPAHRWGRREP